VKRARTPTSSQRTRQRRSAARAAIRRIPAREFEVATGIRALPLSRVFDALGDL
jgi:hypothetical protein